MELSTVGDKLHWCYANLAMAHAAVSAGHDKYGRVQFMVRARLFAGLRKGTMQIGSLADDERLKLVLPQACCYCGAREQLTIDHLMPTKSGGSDSADNLVWACRTCNSSKGARDALAWLAGWGEFPPLLLLRRYLKVAIAIATSRGILLCPIGDAPDLPFSLGGIPTQFPQPGRLKLWVAPLE